jgi:hypothetical protein
MWRKKLVVRNFLGNLFIYIIDYIFFCIFFEILLFYVWKEYLIIFKYFFLDNLFFIEKNKIYFTILFN